ncbi:hypothetical protein BBJ29_001054 [Phytophthora kernoviae]|uniref:Necrosis inducing protein NPP1 type n=1 Tax=Phytophthora kernoviae TaxID=325452 RepID=A0A3F2RVU6_9STRA|nr:hypothetical protein BBJ29_001054 [Phytophthora kernoviae]RLN65181.1 hypothetical protein BBP00_00003012 [Phytophthora kernoviae]
MQAALAQAETLGHDELKPFAQPEPITISEKVAVKFKPQIHITNGCHPYPAVNDIGQTSGGLKFQLKMQGLWLGITSLRPLDMVQCGYSKVVPPNADGTSVKVNYESHWPINHALESTSKSGEFQDLIMWDQMTDAARTALNDADFDKANVPMKDGSFVGKLDKAWPF